MSISLVPEGAQRPRAELTARRNVAFDPTRSVIVDVEQLTGARDEARHVSRRLHNIESLSELDWSEFDDLCRTAHHTARLLQDMLGRRQEGGAR